jgi:hypothetical protein
VATEQIPFFKGQHGFLGHTLGGWAVSANYVWATGQRYTPFQAGEEALQTSASNNFDSAFVAANVGADVARPFVGNVNAPASQVGIYAGDAGITSVSPTTLLSLNNLNAATPQVTPVTNSQVRYIVNAATSESIFGTPFGGARNLSQDAPSNIANLALFKNMKINERANLEFSATFQNIFNHANFQSIDAIIEDAGIAKSLQQPGLGFADPSVTNDVLGNALGNRLVRFGLTFRF